MIIGRSDGKGGKIVKTCPKCGREYEGYPAISRVDNETEICPECGTREALESAGISPEKQEEILKTIRQAKS